MLMVASFSLEWKIMVIKAYPSGSGTAHMWWHWGHVQPATEQDADHAGSNGISLWTI